MLVPTAFIGPSDLVDLALASVLPILTSAHTPCKVEMSINILKSSLFRLDIYWPLMPGLQDLVKNAWSIP